MVLRVVSNQEMIEEERKAARNSQAQSPVTTQLEGHIRRLWVEAREWKNQSNGILPSFNTRLLNCLRTRRGVYSPTQLAEISATGGSKVYSRLSDAKSRTVHSWLTDIFLSQDRPWVLKPTPDPAIPFDLSLNIGQLLAAEAATLVANGQPLDETALMLRAQKLKEQANRKTYEIVREATFAAEKILEDQLLEGGFYHALNEAISDFVTYPVCVIAGPFVELRKKLVTSPTGITVEERPTIVFRRVSPFDFYTSPYATRAEDPGAFEHVVIPRERLEGWRKLPEYNVPVINSILASSGSTNWLGIVHDNERAQLEGRKSRAEASASHLDTYDGLMFWGNVPGTLLMEWGLEDEKVPDPFKAYPIAALLVDGQAVYVRMNPDPLGGSPYHAASYEEVPNSWAGNALSEVISDIQDGANGTLRALMNNLAISSGPQVGINTSRLDPADSQTANKLTPWRIWPFIDDLAGSNSAPITFFQPQSHSNELLSVYKYLMSLADDISGVPRYMAGGAQDLGGVGRTASGMNMLMGHATKAMKLLAQTLETRVIVPKLERLYTMNKLHNPEFPATTDAQIIARGASGVMQRDATQLRRNEFLAATANPIDVGLVSPVGRAIMLREQARELDLPIDDVAPDPEMIKQQMQMMQEVQRAAPAKQPAQRPAAATQDQP